MCLEAFDISEKLRLPVMLRIETRLAHSRAAVQLLEPKDHRQQNPISKIKDKTRWTLTPANSRRNYAIHVEKQKELAEWSAGHKLNRLELEGRDLSFAVISSGLGGNYYEENLEDFVAACGGKNPAHLHIGAYPIPMDLIRKLCEKAEKILVIEEGQPFIEERLRGILPQKAAIMGKLDGTLNRAGEIDPDTVRKALSLPPRPSVLDSGLKIPELPGRPPQLCQGCSHIDSYNSINKAVAELDPEPGRPNTAINSDIGCYSLGAAPPYSAIESIVCMGASVGMAHGAAEAGIKYSLAVVGDSTFLHSGITCLVDAVQTNDPMTVIILDNYVVAMTGCQKTIVPSDKIPNLVRGLGVEPDHVVVLEAKPNLVDENAARLKKEMEYRGVSVVIFQRECLEAFRKRNKGA